MRSFSLVLVFVAACGVEGEAFEGADREAQLRGEASLDVVIRSLGSDGEACTTEASGEVSCLSDELRRPRPIGVGELAALPVYLCAEGADGALTGCHEETAQYECDDNDGDGGSCLCSSFVDCALMILSGDCADSAECDDDGCACTH